MSGLGPDSLARVLAGTVMLLMPTGGQWQPRLGAPGEQVTGLDELEQSLEIVVTTPLNSVPGRPGFGSTLYEFVDDPIDIARPKIIQEVIRAVAANLPRVTVLGVTVLTSEPGTIETEIAWKPTHALSDVERAAARKTRVTVP